MMKKHASDMTSNQTTPAAAFARAVFTRPRERLPA
jgi:hypothetical protein